MRELFETVIYLRDKEVQQKEYISDLKKTLDHQESQIENLNSMLEEQGTQIGNNTGMIEL